MAYNYGAMAFWGIAALTQLLSNFGILVDINMMVWWYGGLYLMVVNMASMVLWMMAYFSVEGDCDSAALTEPCSMLYYLRSDALS